jgi:hypothetical protein
LREPRAILVAAQKHRGLVGLGKYRMIRRGPRKRVTHHQGLAAPHRQDTCALAFEQLRQGVCIAAQLASAVEA